MAAYTPNEALNFAKTMVKGMPLSDATVAYQILDYVASIMWMAAPWSWTLGLLPTTPLVPAQTDYTVVIPTDFAYIEAAYLTDGKMETWLHVDSILPVATASGAVTKVAVAGTNTLRVHPKPLTLPNLVSIYKKIPTKITAANYTNAGASGVPDQWFWVYQLGVLWLAYHYADDVQRAGLATVGANGQTQYTGFLGAFQNGLEIMRQSEKLPLLLTGEKSIG